MRRWSIHRPCWCSTNPPSASTRKSARHPRQRPPLPAPEGMAVLYTTHRMEEAERLCDRIGIIDHGFTHGGRRQPAGTRRPGRRAGPGRPHRVRRTRGVRTGMPAHGQSRSRGRRRRRRRQFRPAAGARRPQPAPAAAGPSRIVWTSRSAVSRSSRPDLEAVFLHLTGTAPRE
ncbi:hypothetical protein ACU686_09335 [Yinghuangia aomiensis]